MNKLTSGSTVGELAVNQSHIMLWLGSGSAEGLYPSNALLWACLTTAWVGLPSPGLQVPALTCEVPSDLGDGLTS